LVVHRLAGDETLIETLAQQAEYAEGIIKRWRDSVLSDAGPITRLETFADIVLKTLGDWTTPRYEDLLTNLGSAERELADANRLLQTANRRQEQLREVLEIQHRLDQLRRIAPDFQQRINGVDERIRDTRDELDRLHREITTRAEEAGRTLPAVKELKNARATLERNQKRLSRALNAAHQAAAELGLDPTAQLVSREAQSLRSLVMELQARQSAMDAAPAMRRLLDEVTRPLLDAEGRGLSDEVALEDPETDLQLSVAQTRLGLATRRARLEGQPPPPEAKKVADELRRATDRLGRVVQLMTHLEEVDKFRRLVATNERRVDQALSTAAPRARAELHALEERRRQLHAVVLELAAERAMLHQQLSILSGEPADVLGARLSAALEELAVSPDAVAEAVADAEESMRNAGLGLERARDRVALLKRDAARAEADVRRAARSLDLRGELGWLRDAVTPAAAIPDKATMKQQLQTVERVRQGIQGVIERLSGHRIQLGAVELALGGVARMLRGSDPKTTEYVTELATWFGHRFSEWFNATEIRRELLPEADDGVRVDVAAREVKWQTRGRERSRPLEAFSSGEQAFAYTRARIASLDQELAKVPNRLIVLDEFGAFIAQDRLSGLLSYLQRRASDHPFDQILVILPVSHDYDEEAASSVGDQKDKYDNLARQIRSQQFAFQVIV
jgi:hypothetical protein